MTFHLCSESCIQTFFKRRSSIVFTLPNRQKKEALWVRVKYSVFTQIYYLCGKNNNLIMIIPIINNTISSQERQMKKAFIILMIIGSLVVSSCATTSHLSVANSATITEANFHMVRPIQKEYTATYLIGFGGGAKARHLKDAITDMTRSLQPNQALAYINVVESNRIPILLPVIITQTTTVSAVIIEYDH